MKSRTLAVTETLRQRLQAGLHLGTLAPGDRLPSIRTVSAELHAGSRVVLAAYRRLAAEGLIQLRARSGVFVNGDSDSADDQLPEVASWVIEVFLRGLARGIPPTDLRRQVRSCLDTVRLRAACVECNDDQLYSLGRQLHDDYGFDTAAIDLDLLQHRQPLPQRAAEADLIVTTRFHVDEAKRLGRRVRRPVVVATLDPVFVNEVRRMLAQGTVWWICTDPRFETKIPRLFPGSRVNRIVLGRDALEAIPPDAMIYATRAAEDRLPPDWHEGHVVTVPRAFSSETARALLAFRVRRNLEIARLPSVARHRMATGNSSRISASSAVTRTF
jgi:DNA-binding transcriptional regulator YhcF (GntR family)